MKRNAGFPHLAAAALCALSAAAASAQAGGSAPAVPSAVITYVEGSDLTVIRGGAVLSLSDPLGFALVEGDQIQTGPGTQAELLLKPRDARVRLAENTVLTISKLRPSGESALALLYGRLRSKVAKLLSAPPNFSVLAGAVAAGVRGTDFGCDLVATQDGSLSSSPVFVYCFEGSVAVSRVGSPPAGAAAQAPVLVKAGRMARVEPLAPAGSAGGAAQSAITTAPIAEDIVSFWKANDFSALPPQSAAPKTAAAAQVPAAAAPAAQTAAQTAAASVLGAEELAGFKKANARKNATIAGGIAFAALSAALEGAGAVIRPSNAGLADTLSIGGLVCAAAGIPVLMVAIQIDPFAAASGR
ncbi:MAG TPA: FecR family protein [Rectinemataceae bacterium]|nr:FecR family protein [Rectinemataceae bacterium]